LQNDGLAVPRTLADSHTRPCLSNIELWLLARVSQIFPRPVADGCNGLTDAAWPGPSDGHVRVAHGQLERRHRVRLGSRMGITSVLYSGAP
jgi:hypothetical protein